MENVYALLSKDMVVFMDHILEELAKFDHVHSYTMHVCLKHLEAN